MWFHIEGWKKTKEKKMGKDCKLKSNPTIETVRCLRDVGTMEDRVDRKKENSAHLSHGVDRGIRHRRGERPCVPDERHRCPFVRLSVCADV